MSVDCVNESPGGILPEKLGGRVRHVSWNPKPLSDQNLWFSLTYFRPEIIGLLRDLSPHDEEVDSSKNIPNSRPEYTNHTLFQTKMVKIGTKDEKSKDYWKADS